LPKEEARRICAFGKQSNALPLGAALVQQRLGAAGPLQDAQQIAAQPKVGAIVTFMLHP
jgi:hypothetical protein